MADNHSRQPRQFKAYQARRREVARVSAIAAHNRYFKTVLAYTGLTAFCLVFCGIYELFSFGEHSLYMRTMFMIPLLGGLLPSGLMAASENPPSVSRTAFNLWNSGLAVHVSGCLVRGIIEISGRVCDYDMVYWIVSGIFLLLATVTQIAAWRRGKSRRS